jgi:hypothetical protein
MSDGEKPSNLRPLLLSTLSVVGLVVFGWYLFGPAPERDVVDEDEGGTKYWYCPKCGLDMICPPEKVDKETLCPRCTHDGIKLEVNSYSHTNGAPPGESDPVIKILLFIPAILAVLLFVSTQLRGVHFAPARGKSFVFPCPACEHPLRYQQADIGHNDVCPVCKEPFIYPDLDARPRRSRRSQNNEEAQAWLDELKKGRKNKDRRSP